MRMLSSRASLCVTVIDRQRYINQLVGDQLGMEQSWSLKAAQEQERTEQAQLQTKRGADIEAAPKEDQLEDENKEAAGNGENLERRSSSRAGKNRTSSAADKRGADIEAAPKEDQLEDENKEAGEEKERALKVPLEELMNTDAVDTQSPSLIPGELLATPINKQTQLLNTSNGIFRTASQIQYVTDSK
ncbi:hypothetical protein F511_30894 [Dorcoceras hygrometricum]|uniref:Uncharacterized protein n=1 Tax=Dorcoceras hygrometricum TaxID=472368 RepID=A0A2Z7BZY3_9LAMI|nr:hypothetical protein F511_30894 [Dorcoceras hygrometricum]